MSGRVRRAAPPCFPTLTYSGSRYRIRRTAGRLGSAGEKRELSPCAFFCREYTSLGPASAYRSRRVGAGIFTRRALALFPHQRDTQSRHPGIHVARQRRTEEHTSELQSLMRISYAVFCLNKKKKTYNNKREY